MNIALHYITCLRAFKLFFKDKLNLEWRVKYLYKYAADKAFSKGKIQSGLIPDLASFSHIFIFWVGGGAL